MGRIIKLNRSGTVGISLIREFAKEHGFVAGVDIEQSWSSELNAIVVKLASKPSMAENVAIQPPAKESP